MAKGQRGFSRWVRGIREESVGGGKGPRGGTGVGSGVHRGRGVQGPGKGTDEVVRTALEPTVQQGEDLGFWGRGGGVVREVRAC